MARHDLENLRLEAPVLEHLRRRLHKVARDARPVEARELGPAQQPVEDVAHLVEERYDVVVAHERWFGRGGLGQVCDHGREGIAARAVIPIVTGEEGPHGSVRVLGLCIKPV